MKVLVTGGNGFIGSWVCKRLVALGHSPVKFDRHCHASEAPVSLGDVRDASAVSESVYHSDAVMHLAGVLGTQESIANPFPAIETNIIGSMNVFQACKTYKKRCVYIAVGNHWMNNPYSITKTTAERFALMMNKECGTEIAVVRGLNAYGPGQKAGPVRKIIPNFILPALRGYEPITIYGDGSQVMDMIYVEDLADILCRALLVDHGVYDRVFEAGTGRATTVLEIAQEVIKQVGQGSIKHVPMRPGEVEKSEVLAHADCIERRIAPSLMPLMSDECAWAEKQTYPYKNGIFDVSGPKYLSAFISIEDGISRTIPYYRSQVEQVTKECVSA